MALKHHPDKNEGDKEAEEKFQKLKVSRVAADEATVSHKMKNLYYFVHTFSYTFVR